MGEPLTLIGSSEQQIADARRESVLIGIDGLAEAAFGDIHRYGQAPNCVPTALPT